MDENLKQQIIDLIKENLKIEINTGRFTMPNERIVKVMFGDEEISTAYFDVVQAPEYEG